ncbi:phenylalanine--tRNA ligase subunit alpha [Treponema phagedenis]|uniref:phenylalanine--tRNA ligase n=1 Tax=Treponema phagedenis TaxID=162 RepID=A0A0B7GVG9_TREPH|nr:phenylalanine--tRNA ligase subunit alpha [Treponema phagedenis]NVP24660.1 phenylalanine--tRNA ligase subunit alpha [Treponema phagedenis]QEJ95680.1 phenylalanine--tRNA ligase subunit alpha [Treponema phagedenis]QEJ97591.1 phenylalanine--tRNA ligase subunit alpha [Treponema phagedenis]QEK03157.1 phenylalanine--tRNA ligase subunit alpha [Treponema phagedenis]QEK08783.1 phenylalanine--tRNA ligase subunit alpha [Treponema phagedenis]
MDIESIIKNLHPLEIKVLKNFKEHELLSAAELEARLAYKEGHANQAFSWLQMKDIIEEKSRETKTFFELTPFGEEAANEGTPEQRILRVLKEKGALNFKEIAAQLGIEERDVGASYGQLAKEGAVSMNAEKKVLFVKEPESERFRLIPALLQKARDSADKKLAQSELSAQELQAMGSIAKKRGASASFFKIAERDSVTYAFKSGVSALQEALAKAGITGDEIGQLTAESLKTGEWKGQAFRSYNIQLPPARVLSGRPSAYSDFLEGVKDKLCSLGFEEFDGPLVETDFWNSDALFMPQFHAARDIHDVYYIKNPTHAKSIEEPFLSRVAEVHETGGNTGSRGWGYQFDRDFTRRLLLRSQGTVLSAHQLAKAKIPGKYFGIVRCFRYDKVDATHLSDFYQTEGIVLGKNVNLKTLLGILKMFAVEIAGATEVKYVGGYFPFTEPSIEVHIKHPVLGWFELGGSGILRPEVTRAMGVDVPVLAWGIGIDRMALMALGLNDLRELFSSDIEAVRLRK